MFDKSSLSPYIPYSCYYQSLINQIHVKQMSPEEMKRHSWRLSFALSAMHDAVVKVSVPASQCTLQVDISNKYCAFRNLDLFSFENVCKLHFLYFNTGYHLVCSRVALQWPVLCSCEHQGVSHVFIDERKTFAFCLQWALLEAEKV